MMNSEIGEAYKIKPNLTSKKKKEFWALAIKLVRLTSLLELSTFHKPKFIYINVITQIIHLRNSSFSKNKP